MARMRHRGPVHVALLLAALTVALALAAPAVGDPGEATNFLIDAAHSGEQPAAGFTGNLTKRWSVDLGDEAVYALIADGRVFTSTLRGVVALDADTGRLLWRRRFNPDAQLAYGDGRLIVSAYATQRTMALDPATGATDWIARTTAGDDILGQGASAAVTAGPVAITTNKGGVSAFSIASGARLWESRVPPYAPPAIAGNRVFVPSYGSSWHANGSVVALDLATGARTTSPPERAEGGGGPVVSVHAGRLYLNDQLVVDELHDLYRGATADPGTGKLGPSYDADTYPASDAHGVYLLSGGTLTGRDAAGAPARWSFTGDGGLTGAPLVAGGRVWIASKTGALFALDPVTGAQRQQLDTGGEPPMYGRFAMAAGDGLLAVPTASGLVGFSGGAVVASATGPVAPPTPPAPGAPPDARSERQDAARSGSAPDGPAPPLHLAWRRRLSKDYGPPLVAAGLVLVADLEDDGQRATVSAFDRLDGSLRWRRTLAQTMPPHLAYAHGVVIAAGLWGEVDALSAADGHGLWHQHVVDAEGAPHPPVISNGVVFIDWPARLAAFRVADGSTVWSQEQLPYWSYFDPTIVVGDTLFQVLKECELIARDTATGAVRWDTGDQECSRLFGGPLGWERGRLIGLDFAWDPADARIVDQFRALGTGVHTDTLSVDVFESGRAEDGLAVRGPDGAIAWSADGYSSPLLVGRHLYADGGPLGFGAFSAVDGTPEWHRDLPGGSTYLRHVAPAAGDGVLALTGQDDVPYDHGELFVFAPGDDAREVTLDSAPRTSAHTPVVTFRAPSAGEVSCAVDGGAWAPCTSPWEPGALPAGDHVFRVRATGQGLPPGPVSATGTWVTVGEVPPPSSPLAADTPTVPAPPAAGTPLSMPDPVAGLGAPVQAKAAPARPLRVRARRSGTLLRVTVRLPSAGRLLVEVRIGALRLRRLLPGVRPGSRELAFRLPRTSRARRAVVRASLTAAGVPAAVARDTVALVPRR